MWWILQIVGCSAVCIAQIVNRKYGVGITSWVVYSAIAMFISYFAFSKSYATAPSFMSAWMFGQTALNVLGLVVGLLYFKDVVSTTQWVGIVVSIIGGYIIILG
jgi:hypothetical protein